MPEGRMLKKGIVDSPTINSLSILAALLFTWAIMYEDSEGYIEAEPIEMKHRIVPMRQEITEENIIDLIIEIIQSGAWEPFISNRGKRLVHDPKFYDHQKISRKEDGSPRSEAGSKFAGNVKPIAIEDVENVWRRNEVPQPKPPRPQPPPEKKKETQPLSAKKVKQVLDENPKLNEIVHKLRDSKKWPEVGSWLGLALQEIKSLEIDDLMQTLEIINEKESFKGDIFPYAARTLEKIIHDKVTRRVEKESQEMKKEEKGLEGVGGILEKVMKGKTDA